MRGSGALTTYLGTAPGVGKTYTMLRAGRLRSGAGQRVVVGWVERHDRAETRAQIGDLEVVPPRPVAYGSGTFAELDVEAVLASGAGVALVDELAHTVVGTTRRRWQEVADILAAGVDVMTTTNLANLVSAQDYVAQMQASLTCPRSSSSWRRPLSVGRSPMLQGDHRLVCQPGPRSAGSLPSLSDGSCGTSWMRGWRWSI